MKDFVQNAGGEAFESQSEHAKELTRRDTEWMLRELENNNNLTKRDKQIVREKLVFTRGIDMGVWLCGECGNVKVQDTARRVSYIGRKGIFKLLVDPCQNCSSKKLKWLKK